MEYLDLYFGITMSEAFTLYRKWLKYFRDIWDLGRYKYINWEVAKVKFSFEEIYHDFWFKLLELYGPSWDRMLNHQSA